MKWLGYTADYNTWVDGTDILDIKMFNDYCIKWNVNTSVLEWHGVDPKNVTKSNFCNIVIPQKSIKIVPTVKYLPPKHSINLGVRISNSMFTILLWLLFLSSMNSILLRDSFKYCSTNKVSLELDVSSVCQLPISKTSNQLQNMAILEKSDYSLDELNELSTIQSEI